MRPDITLFNGKLVVQVIVGSFLVNAKNNAMKGNASGKLPSPLRGPSPLSGFRSGVESSQVHPFPFHPTLWGNWLSLQYLQLICLDLILVFILCG